MSLESLLQKTTNIVNRHKICTILNAMISVAITLITIATNCKLNIESPRDRLFNHNILRSCKILENLMILSWDSMSMNIIIIVSRNNITTPRRNRKDKPYQPLGTKEKHCERVCLDYHVALQPFSLCTIRHPSNAEKMLPTFPRRRPNGGFSGRQARIDRVVADHGRTTVAAPSVIAFVR